MKFRNCWTLSVCVCVCVCVRACVRACVLFFLSFVWSNLNLSFLEDPYQLVSDEAHAYMYNLAAANKIKMGRSVVHKISIWPQAHKPLLHRLFSDYDIIFLFLDNIGKK